MKNIKLFEEFTKIGPASDSETAREPIKKPLAEIEVEDKVWRGGDSGFCRSDIETVKDIAYKYDEDTGEKYKVIILAGNRKFDSRTGYAINPPLAYYIRPAKDCWI